MSSLTLTFKKHALRKRIVDCRKIHKHNFEKAMRAYWRKLVTLRRKQLEAAQFRRDDEDGEYLVKPEHHLDAYDRAIGMLESSTRSSWTTTGNGRPTSRARSPTTRRHAKSRSSLVSSPSSRRAGSDGSH